MVDLNKRLVEVETILGTLDNTYKNKIPKEIWEYIKQHKDNDYIFYYDKEKSLMNQTLDIDTVAILTYINMEYLLNKKQKQHIKQILRKDEVILEKKKREMYNPDNLFKQNRPKIQKQCNSITNEIAIVEYKESYFTKIRNWFKQIFKS